MDDQPLNISLPHSAIEKAKLNAQADEKVLMMLRKQPTLRSDVEGKKFSESLYLYRSIIPVLDRTIAFAGYGILVSTSIWASVQGLWISAYSDWNLNRLVNKEGEIIDEAILHIQWGKWRYLCGYGANSPGFVFSALSYVGFMLRDLSIENQMKCRMLKEVFQTYGPEDFVGLVREWRAGHRKGPNGKVHWWGWMASLCLCD